ncbi:MULTISPECIES: hypothetical protein [Francisella]|uniref:hypothetical protein n=1 Tax=Francisella TaxID=262 RepID=UPI0011B60A18|nr:MULTISPECIES: hypothetical protein [Francisella]
MSNTNNTENLFFIDIKNEYMTNKDHEFNLDVNDKVLFDKSIKAEPNNIAIIKNYQDECNIVLLKKISTKEFVGTFLNEKYKGLEIAIKEVIAIALESRKPSRVFRG